MISKSTRKDLINDRLLQSWVRCRRKAWLDSHGDKSQKIWTAHKALQLDHQKKSFLAFIQKQPGIGIKACLEGKTDVFGVRVQGEIAQERIKSNLVLSQKTKGKSKWGEFSYRPVITRQGKNITREHKLLLMMNGILLEKIQGFKVNKGVVICLTNNGLKINTVPLHSGLYTDLIETIHKIKKDLSHFIPPPITSNRKKCSLCSWQNFCNQEAINLGDLSEVNGIGKRRKEILNNIGVKSIKDLARENPISLQTKLNTFGEKNNIEIAHQIILQAISQVSGKKKRINTSSSLSEIKKSQGILIYDIESDPDSNHDFLHGFISIKRSKNGSFNLKNAKYHNILNLENDKQELIWKRIKRKLNQYKQWPVLHYGQTELLSIIKIAKINGASTNEIRALKNRFIDIHSCLKSHWILPTNNYSLKAIAKWLGFNWREPNADGPKALLWWRQWKCSRKTGKKYSKNLSLIFDYNRDDCLATWEIAKWILEEN